MHRALLPLLAVLAVGLPARAGPFAEAQERYPRVQQARENAAALQEEAFRAAGLTWPPAEVLLRAFKRERVIELWAADSAGAPLLLVKSHPFTASSGGLGPKRCQGDRQIPEGAYHINRFNPASSFHLSLGLNYPNASDRIRGCDTPGGDIFIHGNRVTIGCIPIGDRAIESLYLACLEARDGGQRQIPVLLFPTRLDLLAEEELARSPHAALWRELLGLHLYFEQHRRPPPFTITEQGAYRIQP